MCKKAEKGRLEEQGYQGFLKERERKIALGDNLTSADFPYDLSTETFTERTRTTKGQESKNSK